MTTADPTTPLEQPHVASFDQLDIRWDPRVLRPRPWTAEQSRCSAAIAHECPPGPILELCCGAGQIGLLAAVLSQRDLVQVDRDPLAAEYARRNAAAAGLSADVRVGPIDSVLAPKERFPLVIADPPWVVSRRVAEFPDDPIGAIDGGADGTDLIRRCLTVALDHLLDAGRCVLQVGTPEQARLVGDLVAAAPTPAGAARRVDDVRDCLPGGLLVVIGPARASGTISESYRDAGDTIFPADATAGYPLAEEPVQEGTAGPNARPRDNPPE